MKNNESEFTNHNCKLQSRSGNGFNYLFKDNKKLDSWQEYLKMREVIIQTNNSFKTDVSNDLGAFTGLLFDIGVKKIIIDSEQIFSEKERKKIAKIIN